MSRKLAVDLYIMTRLFPKEEMYALSGQLKRASLSVASNIAEGTSRTTAKDKAHFSKIAFSSHMETLNQLIIASDLYYINDDKLGELRLRINEIGNKINALRKSQISQAS